MSAHQFGCCPRCRSADGPIHINIWKENYATCPGCRVFWWCGHGILSSGLFATDAERASSLALLQSCERIEDTGVCPHPYVPPDERGYHDDEWDIPESVFVNTRRAMIRIIR